LDIEQIKRNTQIKNIERDKLTLLIKKISKTASEEYRRIVVDDIVTEYLISNFGNVIHDCGSHMRHIKSTRNNSNGYYHVIIYVNKIALHKYIHRLVATAFIEIPDIPNPEVNHKDGNKWNNTVWNLEWVTCSENKIHAYKNNLMKRGEQNSHAKYSDDIIIGICDDLIEDILYPRDIAKKYNVPVSLIHDIKNHGTRRYITDKYDFSSCRFKNKKYDDESINLVKKLLCETKYSGTEISKITSIPPSVVYYYKSLIKS
jgi:hypothetical protein